MTLWIECFRLFWAFVFPIRHQCWMWCKWCESSFICGAGFTGMFRLIKWSLISSFFSHWDNINYCGLFMYLPNSCGDKYCTLFNETKLKTLPTQLAISCNLNKNIKLCWRVAVCLWPSSNLGEKSCFPFLSDKWLLHVPVSRARVLEGLTERKRESKGLRSSHFVFMHVSVILRCTIIRVWSFVTLFWYFGVIAWDFLRGEWNLPSVTTLPMNLWFHWVDDMVQMQQIFYKYFWLHLKKCNVLWFFLLP